MEASQQHNNKRHDLEEGVSISDPKKRLKIFVQNNYLIILSVCVYAGDASQRETR